MIAQLNRPVLANYHELLTPREAAQLLDISPTTLKNWVAEDRIDYMRLPGGHRRYYATQIRAIAEARTMAGPRTRPVRRSA